MNPAPTFICITKETEGSKEPDSAWAFYHVSGAHAAAAILRHPRKGMAELPSTSNQIVLVYIQQRSRCRPVDASRPDPTSLCPNQPRIKKFFRRGDSIT